MKQEKLNKKIDEILSIEELEERLEMNSLSILGCCYTCTYQGSPPDINTWGS